MSSTGDDGTAVDVDDGNAVGFIKDGDFDGVGLNDGFVERRLGLGVGIKYGCGSASSNKAILPTLERNLDLLGEIWTDILFEEVW
mmetsp:Transcript_22915/g.32918  ORF Transcript_22915/g.32918 Transcript_22915/m.32918 type:complete len:85 (-) Transcript_22915:183-437(-)